MIALLLAACSTEELSPSWLIDRTRILAAAAEPAEPRPGEEVTFSSLVVHPELPIGAVTWFGCLYDEADEFGCALDEELMGRLEGALSGGTTTGTDWEALYEELQDAGLLGVEPFLPPTLTAPEDLLDGLDEQERLEGRYYLLTLTAFPVEDDGTPVEDDVEVATKRLVVSEAITPNHNPVLTGILVDGVPAEPGKPVPVAAGAEHALAVQLADDAVEDYVYVNSEGVEEQRTEEPYFNFYVTAGDFPAASYVLWPDTEVTWTAPESLPEGVDLVAWAVVRDRRGGMGWARADLALVP